MANSNSGADLLKGALQKAGEVTNGNSPYHELALKYLNNVYLDLLSGGSLFLDQVGEPWPWARARTPKSLVLKAAYETGTLSLTNGSASGTFSVAPSASLGSFKDRYLAIDGTPDFYKIVAHTAGTTGFTMDSVYADSTGAGLTFKAHKLIYSLSSDILRLCAPMRIYRAFGFNDEDEGQILGIDINSLQRNYPLQKLEVRIPLRFATLYRDETEWLIQFSSSVIEDIKVDFDWIPRPDDLIDSINSVPSFPRERRHLIEAGAAHFLLIDKKDSEATYFANVVKQGLQSMLTGSVREDQQTSRNMGQLTPRQDQISKRRFRGVY